MKKELLKEAVAQAITFVQSKSAEIGPQTAAIIVLTLLAVSVVLA